ncbi:hypothetical protein CsSME_00046497 [Camellia sinensis var. sinensis]
MAVGVLALQGSFNEHIAGHLSLSLSHSLSSIHTYMFKDIRIHVCLYVYALLVMVSYKDLNLMFVCFGAVLRRLGVKGVEIRKPEQLQSVTSLIIPGGESTTMAKLAEYHNLVPSRSLSHTYIYNTH